MKRIFTAVRICAFVLLVQIFGSDANAREARIHFAESDSVVRVETRALHGIIFLDAGVLPEKLGLNIESDWEAGLVVVCGRRNCEPLFLAAEEDALVDGDKLFVSAQRALLATCAEAKVKREDISLSCHSPQDLMRVGADSGQVAPGFALKAISDSLVTLDGLTANGNLLLGFVRSGEWDPTSRLLLRELQTQSDSLRKLGIGMAVIHGYDSKTALKWAKDLWISYPLLTDSFAAVMRGYHVFDKGHLARPALLAITKDKRIAWKKVFEENETPGIEEAVQAIRQK
jgi:peroxiredoxin